MVCNFCPVERRHYRLGVPRRGIYKPVLCSDDLKYGGTGAEIAARVTERCFHHLAAPVLRVTGFDIPYPPPMLEHHHLPGVDRILDAVTRLQWED